MHTSVELWDDSLVVHFAQERVPAPGLSSRAVNWGVTDDCGTRYKIRGGGSGGADRWFGRTVFQPAVPSDATRLMFFPPLLRLSEPFEVELT